MVGIFAGHRGADARRTAAGAVAPPAQPYQPPAGSQRLVLALLEDGELHGWAAWACNTLAYREQQLDLLRWQRAGQQLQQQEFD